MYSLGLSLLATVLVTVTFRFIPWIESWFVAFLPGMLAFFVTQFLVSRKYLKVMEEGMKKVQRQVQAGQVKVALKTIEEEIMPLCKWIPLLEGQLQGQMGTLYYADKNESKALEHLEKSSNRATDARMLLASIYFRKKEYDRVSQIMDAAIKGNKKHSLAYNAYAFMLHSMGKNEEAMAILQKSLKPLKENEATKDNLLRLQNGKKLNMKPFGMTWYQLQLEKPPVSMMQDKFAGRRGFRQPKKGR